MTGEILVESRGTGPLDVGEVVLGATSKRFAVVDGGMHQNYVLAGGMGQVIRRNFRLDILPGSEPAAPVPEFELDIAGCLCTPQDVLARSVKCRREVRPGDRVVFFNCGAYGLAASPTRFLSHPEPHQALLD